VNAIQDSPAANPSIDARSLKINQTAARGDNRQSADLIFGHHKNVSIELYDASNKWHRHTAIDVTVVKRDLIAAD
jgi:hypothetical protein